MENEQTIDAICSDLVRYSETVHSGASRAMRRAEHALLSAGRQLAAKDAEIAALKADAERMRWILDGNGYFRENEMLCGHGPCSEEAKSAARAVIDAAMKGEY